MVHGTVVQESPQRRGRNPTIQTLGDKSWDSTEEVLGQSWAVQSCNSLETVQSWESLGPEQSWYGLGTVQSWDGTVLGQCSSAVLGQCSLGTVRSWNTGLGTVVLGQWSWDSALGTVVLGHWFWDSGLRIVVLGQ